jgi:hypothetical protein
MLLTGLVSPLYHLKLTSQVAVITYRPNVSSTVSASTQIPERSIATTHSYPRAFWFSPYLPCRIELVIVAVV